MRGICLLPVLYVIVVASPASAADTLPFNHKIEVYREKDSDTIAFAVRLEQPFLAEEFEKSNYLRLTSLDENSYLIYPKETKFERKHAEFYGRLRGSGVAKLQLSYEIISENLDGSRRVDTREAEIEVAIPPKETGPESLYRQWAEQQNVHFANLLQYYPYESFFEYVLLQSQDRYGVKPPSIPRRASSQNDIEFGLYHTFSGGLAMQQSLQRQTLGSGKKQGDLNIHISRLAPPNIRSLDYEELLKERQEKEGIEPQVHELSRLIPADQYFLQFNSMQAGGEVFDLSRDWGENLLKMFKINATEQHLQQKLESQLCINREELEELFAKQVVDEFAMTGSDTFLAEGADVAFVFRLNQPDQFAAAAERWIEETRQQDIELNEREFNYRGHRVAARYTNDRVISSFVVTAGEFAVFSNSHVAIRKVIDTMTGEIPALIDAADYRYITTILPPSESAETGYLFASEAFLKRLVSPQFKISEKRRLECFNNLVMLNNASLFYRLEHNESPESLTDLVEGHFIDPDKLVCPHGGAYAFDAHHDSATCSLHNRLKYLTPNAELDLLKVSSTEQQEYDRYKKRYESYWQNVFDPIAARLTTGSRVKMEFCFLPFANSGVYRDLQGWVDKKPQPVDTSRISDSAVASIMLVPGRDKVSGILRMIPGVNDVLEMDPTLTDLSWIGDQVSIHFCDDDTILEIDPTQLERLQQLGSVSVMQQGFVATAFAATNIPIYATIDVDDEEKATRLLDNLVSRIFLKGSNFFGLNTELDAYRLPDYQDHRVYALSFQLYAVKIRLYVSLVDGRLVAATKPYVLEEVIDAASRDRSAEPIEAHAVLRLNRRALNKLNDDLQVYWAEKSRQACHRNIMSIYNLVKLYDVPVDQVDQLSDAKYGVTYFCPDHGHYHYHSDSDQVVCSNHGNRQHAKQALKLDEASSFAEFVDSLNEVVASLRFSDEALITTVEISREE